MELSISSNDYHLACKNVQNLLNGLEVVGDCGGEDCDAKIDGVPSASEIVDAVWKAIR